MPTSPNITGRSKQAARKGPEIPFVHALLRVEGVSADGPSRRRLLIDASLQNPSNVTCSLISHWSEITADPGGIVGEGALLKQLHNNVANAVLPANGRMHLQFIVQMDSATLAEIERLRTSDVTLHLSARLLFAPAMSQSPQGNRFPPAILGLPWEVAILSDPGRNAVAHVIPQSEWIKLLSTWQWSELHIFELAFDPRRESPRHVRAFNLIRSAENRLRRNDFPGVLQDGRQALESLARDHRPSGSTKDGYQELLETQLVGARKQDRADAILLAASNYGHLARHENRPHKDITRADAVMYLRMILTLLAYLASAE